MHSLRSKWFAVLLACVFMFAAYGHSPAAELPQTGALAPAEALQLMSVPSRNTPKATSPALCSFRSRH